MTVIHELKKSSEATDIAKEKKLDDKLQVFLKAATDNCVGNTVKCKNEIQGEMQKVRLLTTKQEARFQSITDQLKNKVDSTSPSTQDESRPKWTHLESLRKT